MAQLRSRSETATRLPPAPRLCPDRPPRQASASSHVLTLQRLAGNRTTAGPVVQRQAGLKESTKVRVKIEGKGTENRAVITNVSGDGSRYTVRFEDDALNQASTDRTYDEKDVTGPPAPIWSKPSFVQDPPRSQRKVLSLLRTGLPSPQRAPGCLPATVARLPVPRHARTTRTFGPLKASLHSYEAAG